MAGVGGGATGRDKGTGRGVICSNVLREEGRIMIGEEERSEVTAMRGA